VADPSIIEHLAPPALCPFCRSNDISTTSKKPNTASYWRCGACGEIWNAERLQRGDLYSGRSGWRR
jgi:transposase-like protein